MSLMAVDAEGKGPAVWTEWTMPVDVELLKVGDRLRTVDGNTVVVVAPSEDGEWILVQYVECPDSPPLVGTQDLCSVDELEALG